MEYTKKKMLGSMKQVCFNGLERIIKKYNIETVLEFGSGYSSQWFAKRVKHLYSVDHESRWFPQGLKNVTCIHIKKGGSNLSLVGDIRKNYDLVLIDCFKLLRGPVFRYVIENIDWKVLCIHDWGRDIKKYDENYLNQFKRYGYGSLRIACKEK